MRWFKKKPEVIKASSSLCAPDPPAPRPYLEIFYDGALEREYAHSRYDEIVIKHAWQWLIHPDGSKTVFKDMLWSSEDHPGGFATWSEAQAAGRARMERLLRDRQSY